MAMLMLGMTISGISPVSAPLARDKVLYLAGYTGNFLNCNPISLAKGVQVGFDTGIMYEPLFGTNVGTSEIINWLGKEIKWLNSTTIQVTLRNDIYWVKITNWANWQAGTGGVAIYRPINTTDAFYSYLWEGAFTDSPSWAGGLSNLQSRVGASSNFEIVSATVFKIHLNASYPWSDVAVRAMTLSMPVMPFDVWQEIITANPVNPDLFPNEWTNSTIGMDPDWMVASGMYLTWSHNLVAKESQVKRNELWWGQDDPDFGRLPYPIYVDNSVYLNSVVPGLLESGDIDWDGNYIAGMGDMMAAYPNVATYLFDPPYFPDKSAVLLVPNHRLFPCGEPWLAKAINSVINYTAISLGSSSGYLQDPSPFLIPADDAIARVLLNTELEDEYRVPFDGTGAYGTAILEEYCYKKDGTWYTKNGPTAAENATYPEYVYGDAAVVDQDSEHDGINVPLGPWTIININGWTDVNIMDAMVAEQVSTLLDIDLQSELLGSGWSEEYVARLNYAYGNDSFSFANYCMHNGINNNLYERYTQLFTGSYEGCWGHYGSYRNSTLVALIQSLDTVLAGSDDQKAIADQIWTIVGENLPLIPEAGHGDWYIYNNVYWVGWPNEGNPVLPCSPYIGAVQGASYLTTIFGVRPQAYGACADIDGNGVINIMDIVGIGLAFGAKKGDDNWDPTADLAATWGSIDIFDAVVVAVVFGEKIGSEGWAPLP